MGWQDRRRLPLCAGGSRVRARLYALIKVIRERRRKPFRVSPFTHHRLRQRSEVFLEVASALLAHRRVSTVPSGLDGARSRVERRSVLRRCVRRSFVALPDRAEPRRRNVYPDPA